MVFHNDIILSTVTVYSLLVYKQNVIFIANILICTCKVNVLVLFYQFTDLFIIIHNMIIIINKLSRLFFCILNSKLLFYIYYILYDLIDTSCI